MICLPIRVFPVPGGPNKSRPFGGPLRPVKISLQWKTIDLSKSIGQHKFSNGCNITIR